MLHHLFYNHICTLYAESGQGWQFFCHITFASHMCTYLVTCARIWSHVHVSGHIGRVSGHGFHTPLKKIHSRQPAYMLKSIFTVGFCYSRNRFSNRRNRFSILGPTQLKGPHCPPIRSAVTVPAGC